MNEKPLISVIVPVYDVEDYLPKCIESIQQQDYKNLEIILVDDGSPDNCPLLCDDYVALDNRIKVLHKENGGLSSARNAGMDISTGEYISFVDSDDTIESDMFSVLMRIMEDSNADIAECELNYTYDNTRSYHDNKQNIITVLSSFDATASFLDRSIDISGCVCNKLYHRRITEELRFPEGRLHEDAYFTYKALYNSTVYARTESGKYNYTQERIGSIMSTKITPRNIIDVLDAFEERNEFFKEKNQEILFQKSKAHYYKTLLSYFLEMKLKLPNEKELINSIRRKLHTANHDITTFQYLGKWKLKYRLFRLCPHFLVFIYKLRERVK